MASPKKKSQAKRSAKHTVRSQPYRAATGAAKTAQRAAQETQNAWANPTAAAKLYQLPFATTDVNEATRQVQSATESALKAGADFWQQFFNPQQQASQWNQLLGQTPSLPGFDGKQFKNLGRDSAEHMQRTAQNCTKTLNEAAALGRENAEALVECGNVAVNVSKDVGAELVNYANRTFAQNVELSKQVLGCRTLNDLFDLSSKFMKSNLDNFFSESVHVSELLFQAATDVSEPLNARLSETTERLTKTMAA